MLTLAVDPGLEGLGVALFRDLELMCAWYSPCATPRKRDALGKLERGPAQWRNVARGLAITINEVNVYPDRVVVELMKVYDGRPGHGKDADDLLELTGVNGCVIMAFENATVEGVLARDWKGQVPKGVMTARIESWLERRGWRDRVEVPTPRALVHNAIDAAGLGMVALGLEGDLKRRG